jgi:hypothetical protein
MQSTSDKKENEIVGESTPHCDPVVNPVRLHPLLDAQEVDAASVYQNTGI